MTLHARRWFAAVTVAVAVLVGAAVLAACGPVTPSVAFTHSTFEGFDVYSYVPAHPTGVVYLFHGSLGSADFATKVETVDTLNELISRGYGFVATESTERTGTKRWDVFDPSLATNPDLARLTRLQTHMVDTTAMTSTTPLFGLGMSNGARFVSLWGQAWKDAGYPVQAIAMYMGRIAPAPSAAGLTVPTYFVSAVNDVTSPLGPIVADYNATRALGTPVELTIAQEQPLSASRFLRIPGIDGNEANAVFNAFVATGAWDSHGNRLVSVADADSRAVNATLPAAVGAQRAEIINQVRLVLAEHQMRGDVKVPVADFFDRF
jgi:hypothetical protein